MKDLGRKRNYVSGRTSHFSGPSQGDGQNVVEKSRISAPEKTISLSIEVKNGLSLKHKTY